MSYWFKNSWRNCCPNWKSLGWILLLASITRASSMGSCVHTAHDKQIPSCTNYTTSMKFVPSVRHPRSTQAAQPRISHTDYSESKPSAWFSRKRIFVKKFMHWLLGLHHRDEDMAQKTDNFYKTSLEWRAHHFTCYEIVVICVCKQETLFWKSINQSIN